MKLKKLFAVLTGFTLLSSLTGCLEDWEDYEDTPKTPKPQIEVSENISGVEINRKTRENTKPMGKDGTWTVFVYLCGSNLESEDKMASMDMQEMVESSADGKVRFIVQTGGSDKWHNGVSADNVERYDVCNGKAKLVDSKPNYNMGDGRTLADFVSWGIEKYPAANMGLVLWNHGSGTISGVCFDEYDDDSILLKELDAALYSVYDKMTEPFEFIGFDACLMSTIETAAILATHANYMVASEETEPGYGWNYTAIGDYLAENPDADGLEVGKVICDSFYDDCKEIGSESSCTLSVTDLRKTDDIIMAFDKFSEGLYTLAGDSENFSDFARGVSKADNFGGNNFLEGYTNMVDLMGIVDAGKKQISGADEVKKTISDAVVYMRNGSDHKNACGLSMYYPLQVQGSDEMQIFKDVCISPYYLGVVDKIAHGASTSAGSIDSYLNDFIMSIFGGDWSGEEYSESDGFLSYEVDEAEELDYIDEDYEPSGESDAIIFEEEPYMDEDGNYGFMLTEEGVNNTESVEGIVYLLTDDYESAICLGYTADIYQDWDDGIFIDNFDGSWFALPDGQLLSSYIVSECDGYDIYTAPIMLNGEETNLRFVHDYENDEVYIEGVWDGIDDNGFASRSVKQLKRGDKIIPLYDAFEIDSEEDFSFEGDEYRYSGDTALEFIELPDGDYLYGFCINDIYGDFYMTDFESFTVEDGDIYFDDED